MRNRIKYKQLAAVMTFCLLLHCQTALAAAKMAVMETYTGDTQVTAYVKGLEGDLSGIMVQVGTSVCEFSAEGSLKDAGHPVHTLVLLDNSLSIPKKDRVRIQALMDRMITKKAANEKISIAVFNEGITYLADAVSEEAQLRQAALRITYENTNTYLTDVLYELLASAYTQKSEDIYDRIVLISDGMDGKSIGYTKEELFLLLKEYSVPIYTVGIRTGKKNNDKQLENMFAISRMTKADSFLPDEVKHPERICKALQKDQDITRIVIELPDELMDGGKKMLKITTSAGEKLTAEAVMPQRAIKNTVADSSSASQAPEDIQQSATDSKEIAVKDTTGFGLWIWLLPLISISAAGTAVLVVKSRKRQPLGHTAYDHSEQENQSDADTPQTEEETETHMIDQTVMQEEGDHTVLMWSSEDSGLCDLILTDTQRSDRSFQVPFHGTAVIGRKQTLCEIVIQDDPSVSGRHCEITQHGGKLYVADLQSSNGTYMDGCRIEAKEEIHTGNLLKIGKHVYRFEVR